MNNIKEIEPNKEIMVPINEGTSTYAYFFLHLLFKMREITQQSCIFLSEQDISCNDFINKINL